MADSIRESREVKPIVHTAVGKFVGCGNEACYCDGSCREDKARDLTIKVTADVDDAITGFKALSRELHEATKTARELEQAYSSAAEAYEDVEKAKDNRIGTDGEMRVEIDGKKVAQAVYARDLGLTTHRDLSEVPTEVLREELSKRTGVKEYVVSPVDSYAEIVTKTEHGLSSVIIEGYARILVIKD